MFRTLPTTLAFAATLALSTGAALAGAPKTAANGILTDEYGMTLYTFDKDKPGMSNCYGGCAKNWPPAMAEDGDTAEGSLGIITRKDGTRQWTLNGMPLYTWIKDKAPGDTTGDGVKGVWHTARP